MSSFEFFLRGEAQIACLGTGGDDEGICFNFFFCVYRDAERTPAQLYGCSDPLADIGPEIAGLVTHVVHKGVGVYAIRPPGEVLHNGGGGELAAGLDAFVHNRGKVGARGVDGCSKTGGASAQDKGFNVFHSFYFSSVVV